jgi:hypothetical protein
MVLPVGDGEKQKSLQMDDKTSSQFVQWLRGLPKVSSDTYDCT